TRDVLPKRRRVHPAAFIEWRRERQQNAVQFLYHVPVGRKVQTCHFVARPQARHYSGRFGSRTIFLRVEIYFKLRPSQSAACLSLFVVALTNGRERAAL